MKFYLWISWAVSATFSENSTVLLQKAKTAFAAGDWKETETRSTQFLKQFPRSKVVEEAALLLIDVAIRQEKLDLATTSIQRFRRQFSASEALPRVQYYQGLVEIRNGKNREAALAFSMAYLQATTKGVTEIASTAIRHVVDQGGLSTDGLELVWKSLSKDERLGPWLLESLGNLNTKQGRYLAAEAAFTDYLALYPRSEGRTRIRNQVEKLASAPKESRNVLLMAPFTGEFAEVGRSQREGVQLAMEEAKSVGVSLPGIKTLDDQGNLILGIQLFRKTLREERIDAIIGPAMSDVATGIAVELSARKSTIPMITPTATTHGIASLGENVFQLNVTTHALGQRIAEFACDCLGLKDFAIVAPHNEYGFQLAEVFAKTVQKKGGVVVAVAYINPDATDLEEPLLEMRQKIAKQFFDQIKWEGTPPPDAREMRSWMADSTFPVDGIFIPAGNAEEANKMASQVVFHKMRGQMLGSSGWYDKSLLLKNSAATHGAYFSVDFQDQPRSEIYSNFSKAYQARWKRSPDRVAALSYDAARFLFSGFSKNEKPEKLAAQLKEIKSFPGVLGEIVFGEDEGVNQNTALYHLEKKTFKEIPGCPGSKSKDTATGKKNP